MDDLNQAVVRLKLADENTESDELESSVDSILVALQRQDESMCQKLLDGGILNTASWSLKGNCNPSCKTKIARMVAEMAKNEFVRKPCIDAKLIPTLCDLLGHDDADVAIQTCRALGNICCDYDEARLAISQCGGLKTLINLLKTRLVTVDKGSPNERLRTVACGFLMNLTYGNGPLQTEAVSLDVVELIVRYLQSCSDDVVFCGKLIMCAGNMSDQDCNKVAFEETGICEILTRGLGSVTDAEQLEMILEVISSLAENDAMKLEFAKADLVETLLKVVDKYAGSNRGAARGRVSLSDEEFDVEKVSTDIVILLLTGDESMRYLFQNGEGKLFMLVLTDWLSSPSPLYKISAALALGNFARSDEHCIKLVELGIVGPLLKLIRKDDNAEEDFVDMRLGHAVLSALRNLAISKVNKPLLLQQDTLATILPLIHMDMHPVQFKLLGTIRMLIDGQAETAVQLGENSAFIQRVVELCECQIHAGVAGEANRLLAALVKHSASPNVMQTIVSSSGIKPLVSMATCEHTLMQNEALVALTLVASTCLGQSVPAMLECGLLKVIKTVLQDNNIPDEVQCNVLTLAGFLTQSETLKGAMKEQKIKEVIQDMCNHSNEAVSRKASSVCQHFS
ncbi:rap1 GTPase-GDP dissociation stimulator 1-B-like [Amphiura filiformis]|uniref:rap1 GTPase-GDP dissociation stimulator 1-B-like n=1 Tax=Amphiura filiformis TaxID=82378 RepID=UPI003B20D9FD